ncbi:MAG: type II secretion system F family protein, partial [Nevskiales bacterium]
VISLLLLMQIYLLHRSSKRHKTLSLQLPDFMDRLLRPLIAGNTIEESFAIATRESPEPIRGLFLSVARQVRFGAPLEEAVSKVATVHELTDLHALAMATKVHRRYGGSIRKMVKSLMHMARSRETSAQELRALTAETRMSAWVLVTIPLAITAFILVRNPDYYDAMWTSSTGRIVLISGFALQFLGAIVIWRMMRSAGEAKA